jgi:hypothetical protein
MALFVFVAVAIADSVPGNAPTVKQLIPAAGSTNFSLNTIEVFFSDDVVGVDASDLLINGVPTDEVDAFGYAHYVFRFQQPATGLVQIAWSALHGIRDLDEHDFAGGSWSVMFDPRVGQQSVVISEFMAANSHTTNDMDGDSSDWIELFNSGGVAVNLNGCFLTDTTNNLTKWRFPGYVMAPNTYLLVWASGKDRTNAGAQLHTNFKLEKNGEYLALIGPATNILSEFAPKFLAQQDDVSFGRDPIDTSITGFYTTPTPGKRNVTGGAGNFAPDVVFSTNSGTFVRPFALTLNLKTSAPNAVIRYTLGTNAPTTNSTLYTGALTISNTVQVRARAFAPGLFPGDIHSEQYIAIHSNLLAFTSDLPLMILHNNGGGAVPATLDQFVMVQTFEPTNGHSSLTNIPSDRARGIFHKRGSSTLNFAKSSFFLETRDDFDNDKDESLLGLPEDSDWVLYAANIFDPPLIHNQVGYELSRQAGRYASRTRAVVVFLKDDSKAGQPITTNDYNGIYVLEEKVKIGKHRVDIAKLDPGDNVLPGLGGGYLLSVDRPAAGEQPFIGGTQQMNFIDPKYTEIISPQRTAQRQYITNYFNQFHAVLSSGSFTNPLSGYAAFIDVDSWIDYQMHGVITRNIDATYLSAYLYKPRNGKIHFGPVWDLDRSQGSTDGRAFSPRVWNCGTSAHYFVYSWWGRLFNDPDFWQRWIDRYQDFRRDVFSNSNVFQIIDTFASEVRQEQPRELAKWNIRPRSGSTNSCNFTYNFGTGSYEGEITFLKVWFSNRFDFIDHELEAPPVLSRSAGLLTNGALVALSGPIGSTIYYTLDGNDPRATGGSVASNARVYSAPIVITNNVRIAARCRDLNHHNLTGGDNPPLSSPWSGLVTATYFTQLPPLLITEIMYHPAKPALPDDTDADEFEFIELRNAGTSALNLVGFRFTNGIDFTFTATNAITTLAPGGYVLLVKNSGAFARRYPGVTNVAGQFDGNLDNSGERIFLEGPLGEPIASFSYDDAWQPSTDGDGYSLVLANENLAPLDWSDSAAWRASSAINGSPGRADAAPILHARRVGENVVLAWNVNGCTLLSATNFPAASWTPVQGATLSADGFFQVVVPADGTARFFQLRQL